MNETTPDALTTAPVETPKAELPGRASRPAVPAGQAKRPVTLPDMADELVGHLKAHMMEAWNASTTRPNDTFVFEVDKANPGRWKFGRKQSNRVAPAFSHGYVTAAEVVVAQNDLKGLAWRLLASIGADTTGEIGAPVPA